MSPPKPKRRFEEGEEPQKGDRDIESDAPAGAGENTPPEGERPHSEGNSPRTDGLDGFR